MFHMKYWLAKRQVLAIFTSISHQDTYGHATTASIRMIQDVLLNNYCQCAINLPNAQ